MSTATTSAGLDSRSDPERLAEWARAALKSGDEDLAIPTLRSAASTQQSALLWQWTALLERSLDEHATALDSFAEAARLAPDDALIAHGRARTAMEAGVPAVALYERARSLAPTDGMVLIGLAAARAAAGEGQAAAADLTRALDAAPMWLAGHEHLAQLMATLGRSAEATASIEGAIRRFPGQAALWGTLLNIQLRRGAYETLLPIVERARSRGVQSSEFAIYEGIHAAQYDDLARPPALFDPPAEVRAVLGTWRIRHLLRIGEPHAALPEIDSEIAHGTSADLWAYAATTWRLCGDPRSAWLEGDPRLVGTFELGDALPPLAEVAATLRELHVARGEYLDQSVRGGTQTDGPLFSRVDPVIRAVREAVTGAVEAYKAQLPPTDEAHPLLGERRDRRVRFSGSWSVRLRGAGHHANHVHPLGWISSALYIALPDRAEGDLPEAGWFTLGAPDEKLRLDLPPSRLIEPLVGRLVLFPSWMWHGTIPFADGERLTIAFDVAHPR